MKVLIINIYFHPDPTGTGLIITELARDLVNQGHEVTVVTSVPHYGGVHRPARDRRSVFGLRCSGRTGRRPNTEDRTPTGARGGWKGWVAAIRQLATRVSLWHTSTLDGIRVIRTAVYVPRRPTLWSRLINYMSFSALALIAGLTSGRGNVILCTSPPLSLGVTAWALSRLKGIPFVFNVQDIYPDAAVLMRTVRHPLLFELGRRIERFVYRRAALITVISEGARANLLAKGVPPEKVWVIPNWVDADYVRPVATDNEFRRSLSLDPANIVMFAGNVGLLAGLETVLAAADALRHRADIRFLIVGEGNGKVGLVARARAMALPNLQFVSTQPREILPQVLGAADLHLVTLKRGLSATSVPSKSYGIMASGRPMVASVDPGSEIWRLVETAVAGVCVPPEEPLELARAIERLCDDPALREQMGIAARDFVVRHHSRERLTGHYGRVLVRVAVSGREGLRRSHDQAFGRLGGESGWVDGGDDEVMGDEVTGGPRSHHHPLTPSPHHPKGQQRREAGVE